MAVDPGYNKLVAVGNVLTASDYDGNWNDVESLSSFLDGWRVIQGFTISAGSGLTVNVAAGKAIVRRYINIASSTVVGGLAPSSVNYIWLLDDETFLVSGSPAAPGQAAAFLGSATTNATVVTSVDMSGKHWASQWYSNVLFIVGDPAAPVIYVDMDQKRLGVMNTLPAARLDVSQADDTGNIKLDKADFPNRASAPSGIASMPQLYARADDLFVMTPGGTEVSLTSLPSTVLDYKQSVRVATTAAGTLATDFENGDTVDGVVLATGNRILIKNQAAGAENGVYQVNASGAPTRATDFDVSAEVTPGALVPVEEGTANADTLWLLTTNAPITLGTTALTFAPFGTVTALAGAGLVQSGVALDVNADGSTVEVSADVLRVKALGITDSHVATANKDGAAGTPSMRTLGSGAAQATSGTDARLSDARTPTAHTASHKHGGSDEVATATPAANAVPKAGADGRLVEGFTKHYHQNRWFRNQILTDGGATVFTPISDTANAPSATEAAHQTKLSKAATFSKMRVYISVNTSAGTLLITFRKGGIDTALVVSVGAGLTGWFEDAVNSVACAADDLVCVSLDPAAGAANSLTLQVILIDELALA